MVRAIASFFDSTDPFVAERRFPLALLRKQFGTFLARPKPITTAAAVNRERCQYDRNHRPVCGSQAECDAKPRTPNMAPVT